MNFTLSEANFFYIGTSILIALVLSLANALAALYTAKKAYKYEDWDKFFTLFFGSMIVRNAIILIVFSVAFTMLDLHLPAFSLTFFIVNIFIIFFEIFYLNYYLAKKKQN